MTSRKQLPTERDFNPTGLCLDAEHAWKNFGGLTVDCAFERFLESPLNYQEDFMFMGNAAFAYYYPVLERYIRSVPDLAEPEDDSESWIIAKGIENQFRANDTRILDHLKPKIVELAKYVIHNIRRFGEDDKERKRVSNAWTKLQSHLERGIINR